ncbi:hypothetical protein SDRG_01730 [Saprolegnia diclina VS20]|uniref:Uncharacterized protein n=1 Tax=Saprolegnia diclina (strain VS20) TaxID=1156394 RepID=T0R2V0_SAPDV|nr:hypothetical protein SDRG_01730 [Saprolegnia diclina VS20]EQC40650.1 hypothetical protein SDRG_01730 [Saprolegnia diclina VS20]|eukprot:XP_008605494.1 hypothetical protein SDRG_01730 [Saprolegnia diclina VS20]
MPTPVPTSKELQALKREELQRTSIVVGYDRLDYATAGKEMTALATTYSRPFPEFALVDLTSTADLMSDHRLFLQAFALLGARSVPVVLGAYSDVFTVDLVVADFDHPVRCDVAMCHIDASYVRVERNGLGTLAWLTAKRGAAALLGLDAACDFVLSHVVVDAAGTDYTRWLPKVAVDGAIAYVAIEAPSRAARPTTPATWRNAGPRALVQLDVADTIALERSTGGHLVVFVYAVFGRQLPDPLELLRVQAVLPRQGDDVYALPWTGAFSTTSLLAPGDGAKEAIVRALVATMDVALVRASPLNGAETSFDILDAICHDACHIPAQVQAGLATISVHAILAAFETQAQTLLVFWPKAHRARIAGFRAACRSLYEGSWLGYRSATALAMALVDTLAMPGKDDRLLIPRDATCAFARYVLARDMKYVVVALIQTYSTHGPASAWLRQVTAKYGWEVLAHALQKRCSSAKTWPDVIARLTEISAIVDLRQPRVAELAKRCSDVLLCLIVCLDDVRLDRSSAKRLLTLLLRLDAFVHDATATGDVWFGNRLPAAVHETIDRYLYLKTSRVVQRQRASFAPLGAVTVVAAAMLPHPIASAYTPHVLSSLHCAPLLAFDAETVQALLALDARAVADILVPRLSCMREPSTPEQRRSTLHVAAQLLVHPNVAWPRHDVPSFLLDVRVWVSALEHVTLPLRDLATIVQDIFHLLLTLEAPLGPAISLLDWYCLMMDHGNKNLEFVRRVVVPLFEMLEQVYPTKREALRMVASVAWPPLQAIAFIKGVLPQLDWSIDDANVHCGCELCLRIAVFCANPIARMRSFGPRAVRHSDVACTQLRHPALRGDVVDDILTVIKWDGDDFEQYEADVATLARLATYLDM